MGIIKGCIYNLLSKCKLDIISAFLTDCFELIEWKNERNMVIIGFGIEILLNVTYSP